MQHVYSLLLMHITSRTRNGLLLVLMVICAMIALFWVRLDAQQRRIQELLSVFERFAQPLSIMTVSVELAERMPGQTPEALIAQALYQAKNAGSNQVVCSTGDATTHLQL